jgi:hypothetical protein
MRQKIGDKFGDMIFESGVDLARRFHLTNLKRVSKTGI